MLLDAVNRRLKARAPTPTIKQIQTALAELGSQGLNSTLLSSGISRPHGLLSDDVGTTKWIEPPLVAQLLRTGVLSHPVYAVEFVVQRETKGISRKLLAYLSMHFSDSGPRTPVMCDDAMFAYTICGLQLKCSEWQVLVFDPHVTDLTFNSEGLTLKDFEDGGAFDVRCSSPLQDPGAVRWISFDNFFNRARWMFCIPVPEKTWHFDQLDFERYTRDK